MTAEGWIILKSFVSPLPCARCGARQKCSVPVSSSLFGDPCPGTSKYVEVHFTCLTENLPESTVSLQPSPPWLLDLSATPDTSISTTLSTTSTITTTTTTTTTTTISSTSTSSSSTKSAATVPSASSVSGVAGRESHTEREIQLNRMLNGTISGSPNSVSPQSGSHCPPRMSRGLSWDWALAGSQASQSCPRGSQGVAVWRCDPSSAWSGPAADLSHCSSHWARSVLGRVRAGEEVTGLASHLAEYTETKPLYGGDLVIVAEIMQTIALASSQPQEVRRTVVESVQRAASSVLALRREETWRDLRPPARAAAATSLLLALQENILLLARSLPQQTDRRDLSQNILSDIRVINSAGLESQTFPSAPLPHLMKGAEVRVPARALEEVQEEDGVVRVIFLLYSSLDRSLPSSTNGVKFLNSRVVTVLTPSGRTVRVSEPVAVTLEHLETGPGVVGPSCERWDVVSRTWSPHHCHVSSSNTSHTTCHCHQFGDFALLMSESPQSVEENSIPHISTLLTVTVSLLAGTLLTVSLTCLIRRLSLRSDNGLQSCLHCRRASKTDGLYPTISSSPTSTTLSGTPTTITSMSSNYFLPSECPSQLQQVKSIYQLEPGQLQQPSVIPVSQLRPGYLRPVSPLGHIYMEIDPVYGTRPDIHSDLSDEEVRRPLIRSSLRTVSGSFRQHPQLQEHQQPPPISIALFPGGEHFVSLNLEQPPPRGCRTVNRQRPM